MTASHRSATCALSPPKVREVLGLIRGLDIEDARNRLRYCERGPATEVLKLLDSAVANAESNDNLPEDELFVSRGVRRQGPTLKRWRPRARGPWHAHPQADEPRHDRGGAVPRRGTRASPPSTRAGPAAPPASPPAPSSPRGAHGS